MTTTRQKTTKAPRKQSPRRATKAVAARGALRVGILRTLQLPALGAYWPGQGGRFMGLMLGDDGRCEYALIASEKESRTGLNHADATTYAASVTADGHTDFSLPTRREARLLFVNGKSLFRSEWYWTSTQPAGVSDYAWYQNFAGGSQGSWYKANKLRARAVRRLVI